MGIQIVQMKGPVNFKNLLLQNHRANFNQIHSKMHPWVKEIHVSANEGPRPFPSWNINEIVKYTNEI